MHETAMTFVLGMLGVFLCQSVGGHYSAPYF